MRAKKCVLILIILLASIICAINMLYSMDNGANANPHNLGIIVKKTCRFSDGIPMFTYTDEETKATSENRVSNRKYNLITGNDSYTIEENSIIETSTAIESFTEHIIGENTDNKQSYVHKSVLKIVLNGKPTDSKKDTLIIGPDSSVKFEDEMVLFKEGSSVQTGQGQENSPTERIDNSSESKDSYKGDYYLFIGRTQNTSKIANPFIIKLLSGKIKLSVQNPGYKYTIRTENATITISDTTASVIVEYDKIGNKTTILGMGGGIEVRQPYKISPAKYYVFNHEIVVCNKNENPTKAEVVADADIKKLDNIFAIDTKSERTYKSNITIEVKSENILQVEINNEKSPIKNNIIEKKGVNGNSINLSVYAIETDSVSALVRESTPPPDKSAELGSKRKPKAGKLRMIDEPPTHIRSRESNNDTYSLCYKWKDTIVVPEISKDQKESVPIEFIIELYTEPRSPQEKPVKTIETPVSSEGTITKSVSEDPEKIASDFLSALESTINSGNTGFIDDWVSNDYSGQGKNDLLDRLNNASKTNENSNITYNNPDVIKPDDNTIVISVVWSTLPARSNKSTTFYLTKEGSKWRLTSMVGWPF